LYFLWFSVYSLIVIIIFFMSILLYFLWFWSVCCLLSSCFLESLDFCPSFLIYDVRRFQSMRDSVVFVMMVLLLVSLSGNMFLGPLLWWHRELFFG
jgi:hypothetical protein